MLFFCWKTTKKDEVPIIKKRYNFRKQNVIICENECTLLVLNLVYTDCQSEISISALLFDVEEPKNDDLPRLNNCYKLWKWSHYYGALADILSYISPFFVFFFYKKQQKKDDIPIIKNVAICENCRSIVLTFCWNSVWNLTFWAFFVQKTHK